MTTVQAQITRLEGAMQDFARCIQALPEDRFLQKMDGWAPRDVLAHMIGWLRYTLAGSEEIRRGQLPFYYADPGEDWCHVNAVLVQTYSSTERGKLLAELEAAFRELEGFLQVLDPAEWDHDFGVRYKGYTITIQNTVEALVEDFTDHRRQIEDWAEATG